MTALASLVVQPIAVFTKAVSAGSRLPLPDWDVAARGASVVVVVNAMLRSLIGFIDRVKS